MKRSEQHVDGSCRNIPILDRNLLGSILLKCTCALVNKSILTILVAETSKVTESRSNMFETCIVCASRNDISHAMEGPWKWNFHWCYILTTEVPIQCSTNQANKPSGSLLFCEYVIFFLATSRLAFAALPLNSCPQVSLSAGCTLTSFGVIGLIICSGLHF